MAWFLWLQTLLPPASNTILIIWTGLLTLSSGWTLWNRETRRRLREQCAVHKSAADTAKMELDILRPANERLHAESKEQAALIAELRAATNLDALRLQVSEHHKEILATMKRESIEGQLQITQMVQNVFKEMMIGFSEHMRRDEENAIRLTSVLENMSTDLKVLKRGR